MEHAKEAAELARDALDADAKAKSIEKWQELFGSKFPDSEDDGDRGNTPRGPFIESSPRSQTGDMKPRRYG